MEFNYRTTDLQRSTHSDQPQQVGSYNGLGSTASGYSGPNKICPNEHRWDPIEMHMATWRELEKQKIREKFIAEERRLLEAEVRRELVIERELAMRRGGDRFLSMPTPLAMYFDPRAHLVPQPLPHRAEGMSLEERSKLLEDRLGMSVVMKPDESRGSETTAILPQRSSELRILEAMPEADVSGGVKRKAEITLAVGDNSELSSASVMQKKVKGEWRCAICQVTTTSEIALNIHLQGKKHKSKEAKLTTNGGNSSIIGFCSKTALKPNKVPEIAADESTDKGMDVVRESVQPVKLEKASSASRVSQLTENVALVQREPKKEALPFWCEMCQKGANSLKVMESHRTGKEHKARLQKANPNGGAVPST